MKLFGVSAAILSVLVAFSSAVPVSVTPSNSTSIIDMNENNGDPKTTPFFITAPLKGTVYKANQTVTTTWLNGINEMFLINLIKGVNPKEMQLTNISFQANGLTGSYAWMVPSNLVGGTYAFQFVYNLNGAMSQAFSNQFKVVNDDKEAATAWASGQYDTLDEATAGDDDDASSTSVSATKSASASKTKKTSISTTAKTSATASASASASGSDGEEEETPSTSSDADDE